MKEEVTKTSIMLSSAHWSKQPAMVEVDLPDVKFNTKWHWNCAVALCKRSWRTDQNGVIKVIYSSNKPCCCCCCASTLEVYKLEKEKKTLKK